MESHRPDKKAAQVDEQTPVFRIAMGIIAILSAFYLISIPLGWVEQRLGAPEVVLFTVVLLFVSGVIFRVEEFAFGEKGLNLKVRQQVQHVEEQQQLQQREITRLRFLLGHFFTKYEVDHLRKLAGRDPFPYQDFAQGSRFWEELFRLRQHGMVQTRNGIRMSTMPQAGPDLKACLEITAAGQQYLELREEDGPQE